MHRRKTFYFLRRAVRFLVASFGVFAAGGGPKTVKFIVEKRVSAESFRSLRKLGSVSGRLVS